MNLSVVTLGDLVADLIVPISHLPIRAHEHQPARDLVLEAGGIGNFQEPRRLLSGLFYNLPVTATETR